MAEVSQEETVEAKLKRNTFLVEKMGAVEFKTGLVCVLDDDPDKNGGYCCHVNGFCWIDPHNKEASDSLLLCDYVEKHPQFGDCPHCQERRYHHCNEMLDLSTWEGFGKLVVFLGETLSDGTVCGLVTASWPMDDGFPDRFADKACSFLKAKEVEEGDCG